MIKPFVIHVLNYHLDGYGHVNNARYLEFLEAARWDFFQQYHLRDALRQANLVVARMDIRYRRAARLDDILHIDSQIMVVQSREIILQQQVIDSQTQNICADATVTLMPTTAEGRIARLSPELFNRFLSLLSPAS